MSGLQDELGWPSPQEDYISITTNDRDLEHSERQFRLAADRALRIPRLTPSGRPRAPPSWITVAAKMKMWMKPSSSMSENQAQQEDLNLQVDVYMRFGSDKDGSVSHSD